MTIAEQMMHRGLERGIKQGIEKGIKQGIEQGIVQGIEKGALKNSIEIAQRMIAEGSNPAFITKVTGLSIDKIKELQQQKCS